MSQDRTLLLRVPRFPERFFPLPNIVCRKFALLVLISYIAQLVDYQDIIAGNLWFNEDSKCVFGVNGLDNLSILTDR